MNGRPWILAAVLVAWGGIVYSNALRAAFVFDDETAILLNPRIRGISWDALRAPPPYSAISTRAAGFLSFAVNHALGGLDPFGFHLFNILLHCFSALLLFDLIRRTLGSPEPAFAIAGLWMVHPLQTAAVTYAVQRSELLASFFYLLTLYGLLRSSGSASRVPRLSWQGGAALACGLGMASKETMVSAPIAAFLFDRAFLAGSFRAAWKERKGLYLALASSWILLATLTLGMSVYSKTSGGFGYTQISPWAYACTQAQVLAHYARTALVPWPLCLDPSWPVASGFREVWPQAAGIGALLAATAWALWKRPRLGFLGAVFFLVLAPTSSALPLPDPCFEHRMYLPLAALAVLAVLAAGRSWGKAGVGVGGAVLLLFSLLTWSRNRDYRSEERIWSDTVRKRPANARAHYNLGHFWVKTDRYARAAASLRLSLRIHPKHARAWSDLGHACFRTGRKQEAEEALTESIRIDPAYEIARNNLGNLLEDLGRAEEAIGEYRKAVEIKPTYAKAWFNLGLAWRERKKDEGRALVCFLRAWRLQPGDDLFRRHLAQALASEEAPSRSAPRVDRILAAGDSPESAFLFGRVLSEKGRGPEAIAELARGAGDFTQPVDLHKLSESLETRGRLEEAAIALQALAGGEPDNAELHHRIGILWARSGRPKEAAAAFREVLRIEPASADARVNLANALSDAGSGPEAVVFYEEALKVRPEDPLIHYNLALTRIGLGDSPQGAVHLRQALRGKPDWFAAGVRLAWLLATDPDPEIRDGEEALQAAQKAAAGAPPEQKRLALDVLGAAYAERGRFSEAIGAARRAHAIAKTRGEETIAAEIEKRVRLYLDQKPFREASGPRK